MTCKLQELNSKILNWCVGGQGNSLICIELLDVNRKNSSFERLVRGVNKDGSSPYLLFKRDKYWRDVRFDKADKFPLKWLFERSNSLRFLNLLRHDGSSPCKSLSERSNSTSSINSHIPTKFEKVDKTVKSIINRSYQVNVKILFRIDFFLLEL